MSRVPAGFFMLALAFCFFPSASHGQDYDVSLSPEDGWRPTPEWTPLTAAKSFAHDFADGVATFRSANGTMIWVRYFNPPLDLAKARYLTLRYRLRDTDPKLTSYFIYMRCGKNTGMTKDNLMLAARDLEHDGRWHTLTTTLHERGELNTIALRFASLPGKEGVCDVSLLRISRDPPASPISSLIPWRGGIDESCGDPLDISGLLSADLATVQTALAVADWFPESRVVVADVPFAVATEGKVAISTPRKERDTLTIPVGSSASEAYLLLGAELPHRMLGYNGWQPGDSFDSPTRFSVKLSYSDAAEDVQMPYCLDMKGYGIWRGIHAYAVAVCPDKTIKEMQIRDGMVTSAFHVFAVTLGKKLLIPASPEDVYFTPTGSQAKHSPPSVARIDDKLIVNNSGGRLVFDISNGLSLSNVINTCHPDNKIQPVPRPIFTVRDGEDIWTSQSFKATAPDQVADNRAVVKLTCQEANLDGDLSIEPSGDGEALLRLRLRNTGELARRCRVVFPEIGLTNPDRSKDLWYAIPRTCLVWSNEDVVFRTGYGHLHVLQWVDFYDRRRGGGVYLSTRTQVPLHRWYEEGKKDGVALARVEYLDLDFPPGSWVEYPPAVLGIHAGDWHTAFDLNQKWLNTWCKPQTPRLDWYRRIWHLRTHWVRMRARQEYSWVDQASGKLRPEEMLRVDREKFDYVDFMHFFDWRISEKYGRWGDYSHYEEVGGLNAFRGMIQFLHSNNIRVGLYLDTYLVSKKSMAGQKHEEEWCLKKEAGKLGGNYSTPEDPIFNACVSYPGWQDYLAETCARVARETGCDGIYLDEGGGDMPNYWCWRENHGHAVPATTIAGLKALFQKVRAALPENVALYTEHTPPDVLIPHLDGAYQYCHKHEDLRFSPGYINIARFAFPDFKPFMITSAGSMIDGIYDGLTYSLFNGAALYTLGYGHDPEAFALAAKIANVLKAHEEAFLSLNPRPLVDTECAGVYCNAFPTKKETVWTLWNGRYRTVMGRVLTVTHLPGATYSDVWNDKKLDPRSEDGKAVIELEIGPRDIGVVAQIRAE